MPEVNKKWSIVSSHDSVLLNRGLEDVFQFIAMDFFNNYQLISPQVCELEKITPGDIRVGVIARQVRIDEGYRSEALFRVSELVPMRKLRFTSLSKPDFEVCYLFEQVGPGTRVTFKFDTVLAVYMLPFRGHIEKIIKRGGKQVVANLRVLLETGNTVITTSAPGAANGPVSS
ncbi:MAG: polyketide cyclase [Gammaproteobacteria bacterium]|nr:polyketide cyclase [Gammaproteobacteria bacterium]MBT8135326.1 polyketide cyclase [Gammaproteobacteria bacterium]NNJ50085.1 polyketide cyclase [Gammaproteobacteria bacterium]